MMPTPKAQYILSAVDRTKQGIDSAKRNLAGLQSAWGGLLASFGAGLSIAGIVAATKKALDMADAIGKASDAAGLTTATYQELSFAADKAGITQDQFRSSLERFVKRVGEAKSETGALNTFLKKYDEGLLQALLSTRNQEDAFNLMAEAIRRAKSDTDRAALASAAFGRAGVRLVNMLRDGTDGLELWRSKARDLGLVLEDDLIREAERANDQLSIMSKVLSVQLTRALSVLFPFLLKSATAFTEWSAKVRAAFLNVDEIATETSAKVLEARLDKIRKEIEHRKVGSFEATNILFPFSTDHEAEIKRLQEEADQVIARLKEIRDGTLANQSALTDWRDLLGDTSDGLTKLAGKTRAQTKELDDMDRALDLIDAQFKALDEEEAKRIAGLDGKAEAQAKANEERKRQLEDQAKYWRDLVNPANEVAEQLAELDLLLNEGKIGWDTYSEAVLQVMDRLDEVPKELEETGGQMNQFAIQAARDVQSAFADFLFDPFNDGLKGLLKGFVDVIRRMLAEAAAAQIGKALFGEGFGTSGKIGGAFGDLLSVFGFHRGGIVGAGGVAQNMSPLLFGNAPRYQTGGIAGLAPNEVPAVLHRGEEVLTTSDPRHRNNQRQAPQSLRLVLVDDARKASDFLYGSDGEKAVMVHLQRNVATVKQILGS